LGHSVTGRKYICCIQCDILRLACKNIAELEEGVTLYMRRKGGGTCVVSSANPMSLPLHKTLTLRLVNKTKFVQFYS
jgi:hypothetical protein